MLNRDIRLRIAAMRPARDRMKSARDRGRAGGRPAIRHALADLNERLRSEFQEFRLDRVDDGTVGVLPVLRRREAPDVSALYKKWEEAGMPEPTEEEVSEHDAIGRASEPIWATGEQTIRPPVRALEVPVGKPRNSQEYRPISSGLALPPLIVGSPAVKSRRGGGRRRLLLVRERYRALWRREVIDHGRMGANRGGP